MSKGSKIGSNKKECERYRNEGRREKNKLKKQEKHIKRLEYFAKRKAEGNKWKVNLQGKQWFLPKK